MLRCSGRDSYGDDHCGAVSCPLAWLRLADLQGPLAVYVHGQALHVLRVSLAYSAGSRVYFIPRSELDRRLRSA